MPQPSELQERKIFQIRPGSVDLMTADRQSARWRSEGRKERRILGIRFFVGQAKEAVECIMSGGLLVAPAAPGLKDLPVASDYRESLLLADIAITDSAFMVMIWNRIERDNIPRISGLQYLRALLERNEVKGPGDTFWIMAGVESAQRNLKYLANHGIEVPKDFVYIAPHYGDTIDDEMLLSKLRALRPRHVVVTIGGGTQERLGLYLKRNIGYLPAIHCIGAAIAFLSGDQVNIPVWADKYYLGWLFRCLSAPRIYVPRYWKSLPLFGLLVRYRGELPPLAQKELR